MIPSCAARPSNVETVFSQGGCWHKIAKKKKKIIAECNCVWTGLFSFRTPSILLGQTNAQSMREPAMFCTCTHTTRSSHCPRNKDPSAPQHASGSRHGVQRGDCRDGQSEEVVAHHGLGFSCLPYRDCLVWDVHNRASQRLKTLT